MCYQNFGMLIQTKDNKVIGTGHFKTNILKSYSEIEDLNGCDIDKLISTHIVYKSESEYKHTFAFAYIDTSNNSELIYYIPTIDTITNEEFEANIKDLFGYQKNMPFTSGYTIHRTGLINVDTIIQITDRCIILKTKDGKLHIHGKPFKIQSPNFVNKDYYIDTREIDNSHYNINEINILDYTNAFDQQGNAIFTELQNVPEILYSTKESEKLYSPIESYILSVESKNIAYSIAHGTHKLTLTQNRLFVNEIDYDLTDDGSELFVDGDLATHQIMMFTIAGLESHKDNSDVEYANSTFSVAYDNSKIVFGRIEISGGDIKFNKYENTLAIDELMSTEFANVSTPSEFYAKIKKITFVKCNILDYFYNTDYTPEDDGILKILQRIIILFLYYMIMILVTNLTTHLK